MANQSHAAGSTRLGKRSRKTPGQENSASQPMRGAASAFSVCETHSSSASSAYATGSPVRRKATRNPSTMQNHGVTMFSTIGTAKSIQPPCSRDAVINETSNGWPPPRCSVSVIRSPPLWRKKMRPPSMRE